MSDENIKRITGLLIIEVVNSNPNGNPDRESDPRVRDNGMGEISPVSFKRKLRDLIELKEGPVYQTCVTKDLGKQYDYRFEILESRERSQKDIQTDMGKDVKKFDEMAFLQSEFVKKYWDARLFGNTVLEEGGHKGYIKTGIVQFGMGLSISRVEVERQTNTKKRPPKDDGKSSGMAPLAYRVVAHGVYVMPFFINPSLAHKSGCKPCDVELLKRLIPYAYDHTRSAIRPDVRIRHAWWIEHKDALGSCPDYKLIDALTPKRKGNDPFAPSATWLADYDVPEKLEEPLASKVSAVDLMNP
jgi:Cas7 group CRISPR-associated protein Csh2